MIVHEGVRQYSREWWELRLGLPTASRFSSIITDKTMKPSGSIPSLIADLLMEQQTAKPSDYREGDDDQVHGYDTAGNPWTERGSDVEAKARIWYQLEHGVDVEQVGFITNDAGTAGCSPDGMADDRRRGLEIKCRSAKYHLRIVLGFDSIADVQQVQGSMWVTGLDRWDAVAFCPGLPSAVEIHYRNPAWQAAFDKAFRQFEAQLKDARERFDRIEGDVVVSNNLAALFSAALQKKPTRPNPLSIDTLADFGRALDFCSEHELLSATDVLRCIEDVYAEDWESVRGMIDYCTRLIEQQLEVTNGDA